MASDQPRRPHGPGGGRYDERRSAEGVVDPADLDEEATGSPVWPTIAYEERPWEAVAEHVGSRRDRLAARGPYQAAVVPEIAQLAAPAMSADTFALVSEASSEIARFDAEMGDDIAPFASVLLRSESAASSRIENLTASAKAIALAELGDPSRKNANLIVNNAAAMESAVALAEHLDEAAILRIHEVLLGSSHPDWAGRWRDQQVWIGGSNLSPHHAMFVPPTHER